MIYGRWTLSWGFGSILNMKINKKRTRKKINIHLEKIIPTSDQINLLYLQLKTRSHNISHKDLPSFEKHKNFVKNNPYRAWFVIRHETKYVGNIYIQFDNSVGLNLDKHIN